MFYQAPATIVAVAIYLVPNEKTCGINGFDDFILDTRCGSLGILR